jgi:hypothetical protein
MNIESLEQFCAGSPQGILSRPAELKASRWKARKLTQSMQAQTQAENKNQGIAINVAWE